MLLMYLTIIKRITLKILLIYLKGEGIIQSVKNYWFVDSSSLNHRQTPPGRPPRA